MAVKGEKSFRISPVGGFNRQDVMDFISANARERREEVEAYRAGAEKLRSERDKLKAELSELSGTSQRAAELQASCDELSSRNEELRSALAEIQAAHASLQEESNSLRLRVSQYEEELGDFGDLKAKMADIEMQAYRRAEAIEAEASQSVVKARAEIMHSLADLNTRYKGVLTDSEAAAYSIVQEMDKMRNWFAHFTDIFEGITAQLQAMSPENRVVRDFIPEEFDEE